MEQYISKSALVAEIEKLKKSHDNWSYMGKCFHQDYETLLSFIDSLEVTEAQKEPVSDDLEEAINTIKLLTSNTALLTFEYGFRKGAEWQKIQDQETIELAEDHAMLAGMVKGKEEAIKKTIDFLNSLIGTGNSTIEEYKKYMNN